MKTLFKNTTKYDKENCNNFIMFHNNKYGKKELLKSLLIIIGALYILIFNIIYKNWYFIILLVLASVLLYFINKYNISKKKKKKNEKKKNKEYIFFFYERYIKIKHRRQYERMTYFEIKKIFETDANFFLYTDENHSLILDKKGFEVGTPKGFSEFIRKKCPFKYSNEKNK